MPVMSQRAASIDSTQLSVSVSGSLDYLVKHCIQHEINVCIFHSPQPNTYIHSTYSIHNS